MARQQPVDATGSEWHLLVGVSWLWFTNVQTKKELLSQASVLLRMWLGARPLGKLKIHSLPRLVKGHGISIPGSL